MARLSEVYYQNERWKRLQQHRAAVTTLALHCAKNIARANIRTKGLKFSQFSARDITHLAEDYLAQHRAELISAAKNTIATSPYFERRRLPPEVFEK